MIRSTSVDSLPYDGNDDDEGSNLEAFVSDWALERWFEGCGFEVPDELHVFSMRIAPRTPRWGTLYHIWSLMIGRCTDPTNSGFANYGGRGIRVCERWQSFDSFCADMGKRPSGRHTLDRINNEGNYEPANCRWATWAQQSRNRRGLRWVTHDGVTLCVEQWSERLCMNPWMILKRLDAGWTVPRALTQKPPARARRR